MKTNVRGMKLFVSLFALASVVLMTMLPASAHVTVDPSESSKGGYGAFTLRVPNEDPAQSTVKLEVQIPQESPITSVRVQPKPGWTYKVEKTALDKPVESYGSKISEVVSKITFEGGQIKPGEFEEFRISMGPLPTSEDSVTLKAIQTYDGGKVSKWVEESVDGEEAEYPAPVIMLGEAQDDHHSSSSSHEEEKSEAKDSDNSNTVAYVGLGVAVVALLAAGVAIAKKK